MRINDEHAYDDRVLNPDDMKEHIFPEFRFRHFVLTVAKMKGQVTGFYALITLAAYLYPEEFPPERVEALKKLTYKVFVAYYEEPPKKLMISLMKEKNITPRQIARHLKMSRENIYYYTRKEDGATEVIGQCLLTYGEYDLMMDFMDCWDKIRDLGEFL